MKDKSDEPSYAKGVFREMRFRALWFIAIAMIIVVVTYALPIFGDDTSFPKANLPYLMPFLIGSIVAAILLTFIIKIYWPNKLPE